MKSSKGSAYERDFCKRLSLWWSNGKSDSIFWRTSNSGGRATTRAKKGKGTQNQYGDVCAIDPIGQPLIDVFTIELKRGYSKYTIHDLFDKRKGAAKQQYEKWIEQIQKDHKLSGSRSWFLVTRRDRKREMILMPKIMYRNLFIKNFTIFVFNDELFSFAPLDEFFARAKPDDIMELAEG